ncbi:MAG: hypothetical protein COC06_09615 [Bacteroidales bacterium]|nr:MAG: hypothetical protein COC06_09615 [Bacteroidales bacterium]
MKSGTKNVWKTLASFFMVLFTMPLGHALMIVMEKFMSPVTLHYSAFAMGAVGLVMVIIGVVAQGDTKQTLLGFFGGLLFWTGWVEFLFMYYAHRYGVQPEIVNGEVVTKPEYLILPATFGLWAMVMTLYMFSIKTGCQFINWWQKVLFKEKKNIIVARPMTRHTSIVTFMELNMLLWTCYLLLMFCYDNNFLGDHHPVTFIIGIGCFIGSGFMLKKQFKISSWGANIRFSIATVIIFWTPVEILGRINFFSEIWTEPMKHGTEMIIILVIFVLLAIYLWYIGSKKKA